MPANTQDFIAGFDPTGQFTITSAQLLAFLQTAYPYGDKGLVVRTVDNLSGVPDVPDAASEAKWQRYIWLRIMASAAVAYVWNPAASVDATYLKWRSISVSSIPADTIQEFMIVDGAVTDDKINSVSFGKITGMPTAFPPNGAAGGDLTGTYPNPTIAANAVDGTKLLSDASVDANRAVSNNHIKDNVIRAAKFYATGMDDNTIFRVVSSAWVAVKKLIVGLAEPTNTEANKPVRVNADGSAFEYADHALIQRVSKNPSAAGVDCTTVLPFDNTTPVVTEGDEIVSQAFTPRSASSLLRISFRCSSKMTNLTASIALFQDSTCQAASFAACSTSDTDAQDLTIDKIIASPGTSAVTFSVRVGPASAGTIYVNKDSGGAVFNGLAGSPLIIEEFFGTHS